MLIKKVARIDLETGLWKEDVILEIAENLEDAKLLGYPIAKETRRKETPEYLEEPQDLKDLKAQKASLEAMPPNNITRDAIDATELQILTLQTQIEEARSKPQFEEIETYQVPPLPQDLIEKEIPQDSGFHHPKWDGFNWIEGLTAEEIAAKNPPLPNWNEFLKDLYATDLDEALAQTSATHWFPRLELAIRNQDAELVVTCWNRCNEGLSEPLNAGLLKTGRSLLTKHSIPLKILKGGAIELI